MQKVEYPDLITNLRAKTIYLATLLELKEYDAISMWSESFKAFLNRKKKKFLQHASSHIRILLQLFG